MAGTPSHALAGLRSALAISQISTGNVFSRTSRLSSATRRAASRHARLPHRDRSMPVTSRARRERSWGARSERSCPPWRAGGSNPGVPRARSSQCWRRCCRASRLITADDDFFGERLEHGLVGARARPAGRAQVGCRTCRRRGRRPRPFPRTFASALEKPSRAIAAIAGPASPSRGHRHRDPQPFHRADASRPNARSMLRAGPRLRFIADRFEIDRAYLGRRFAGQ